MVPVNSKFEYISACDLKEHIRDDILRNTVKERAYRSLYLLCNDPEGIIFDRRPLGLLVDPPRLPYSKSSGRYWQERGLDKSLLPPPLVSVAPFSSFLLLGALNLGSDWVVDLDAPTREEEGRDGPA